MIPTITINMPRLYPKQARALFDPARIVVVEASTKSGKTSGALVWQGARVMNCRKRLNSWWVAPVSQQAGIAYRRAKEMFRGLYIAHDSDQRLTFRNGASWWFKSGEKPDNLYGEDVADAVIDEFTRVREEAWHALRSTLTYTRGPVRMIGNVRGRGNWGYRIARIAEAGEPGYAYHKIVAADAVAAGVLNQAEIDKAHRDYTAVGAEHIYFELYECKPSDDGGNPFGLAKIQACIYRGHPDGLSPLDPVAFGIDLAKSHDWTVVVGLDEDGRVCHLERWQSDWGQTQVRILAIVNGWPALVDSTGVGDPIVECLTKVRPNIQGFKFTSQSKQQLMEGLASAIHQQEVRFPEGWLSAELETFDYEYTRTGVKYAAPEPLHDDGVCALGLAVKQHRERSRYEVRFAPDRFEDEHDDQ